MEKSSADSIEVVQLKPLDGESDLSNEEAELSEEQLLELELKKLKPIPRSFAYNLAYYVNENVILQKFVEMGVQIFKWDHDRSIGEFILRLDMERDVKPRLIFLHDLGVKSEDYAFFITKNPLFFKQSLDDLKVRVDYLRSKKFDADAIVKIVVGSPHWLNTSVEEIDTRLG